MLLVWVEVVAGVVIGDSDVDVEADVAVGCCRRTADGLLNSC